MFEIPNNLLEYFFDEIQKKGKYKVIIKDSSALIIPREQQQYYKPVIVVKDLLELELSLVNFVENLNKFFKKNNNLEAYHDLSFFFNNLFLNMNSHDALDLVSYINKRNCFFTNKHFQEFESPVLLTKIDNASFYVQRYLESPGLETPYVLLFTIKIGDKYFDLPLVRYAFDEHNICHLFAVQYGQNRECSQEFEFKTFVNQVNSGISKYRNVSPSFILTTALFLKLLNIYEINKIVVPDFLFGRYRNYYRASSEVKSDLILERILNNFIRLLQRLEIQIEGFEIESFPNELDGYTHINIKNLGSQNRILRKILEKNEPYK